MDVAITQRRKAMLKKLLITAAALGFAAVTVVFSTAALAQPPYWAPAYGWRAQAYAPVPYYYRPRPVYVVPAPRVYYAPPPAMYYPAPVYRPVPVYPAAPAYPAAPGISIRLNFPL
jgi:hypothetical protein